VQPVGSAGTPGHAARGTKTDEERDQLEITGFDAVCTATARPPIFPAESAGPRREAERLKAEAYWNLFQKKKKKKERERERESPWNDRVN